MGAVANGCSSACVQALLNANPGSVRVKKGQHTLLHQAACHNQSAATVEILLAAWPEAAQEVDEEQNAPLHFVSRREGCCCAVPPYTCGPWRLDS